MCLKNTVPIPSGPVAREAGSSEISSLTSAGDVLREEIDRENTLLTGGNTVLLLAGGEKLEKNFLLNASGSEPCASILLGESVIVDFFLLLIRVQNFLGLVAALDTMLEM